jgi:hypothetical protein
MYMLSGCELIDTENISLPSQNMKFGGEWAKRTSHNLHILSSRLIIILIKKKMEINEKYEEKKGWNKIEMKKNNEKKPVISGQKGPL